MDRADVLARCAAVLKSSDGQILMRELEAVWNPATTTIDDKLQYRVGLRDAYHFLRYLRGDYKDE